MASTAGRNASDDADRITDDPDENAITLDGSDTSTDERGGGEDGRAEDVSEWFGSNVSSGQRGGVDEEAAEKLASRERHQQQVNYNDRVLRKFAGAQFVAHATEQVKFTRTGDMLITLQIPFQFKHLAMPLTDAFGIPLSVDVQVWKPYTERRAEI